MSDISGAEIDSNSDENDGMGSLPNANPSVITLGGGAPNVSQSRIGRGIPGTHDTANSYSSQGQSGIKGSEVRQGTS